MVSGLAFAHLPLCFILAPVDSAKAGSRGWCQVLHSSVLHSASFLCESTEHLYALVAQE